MRTTIIIAILATVLNVNNAFAQRVNNAREIKPYIEAQMGYNDMTVMGNVPNGISGGLTAAIPVSKSAPLYVRSGLTVDFAGWKDMAYMDQPVTRSGSMYFPEDVANTTHVRTVYATVPVCLAWEQHVADVISVTPYAGIYAKGHLWGTVYNESNECDLFGPSTFTMDNPNGVGQVDSYNLNRFNAGWQVGVDVHVKRFMFGAELSKDFGKVAQNWGENSRTLTIHYGWLF